MQQIPNNNLDAYLYDALSNAGFSPPSDMWARIECELPDEAEMAMVVALSDATVAPPQGVWEKIANEMDTQDNNDTDLFATFAALNDYTVTPDDKIWNHLETVLPLEKIEDISFTALANYEVAPAADFWTRIESVLETQDSDLDQFTALAAAETAPEADFWNRIESVLQTEDNDLAQFTALATAETAPPSNLWDILDTRLEEEDELVQFAALADHEVEPSEGIWSRISLPTENSDGLEQFAALATYEMEPTAANWDKIAARLEEDEDSVGTMINRLRHSEMEPAGKIWSRIGQDLPLNPALRRHLTNFSRVAAVLLFAFTASVFYNQYNGADEPALAHTGDKTESGVKPQLADDTFKKTRRGGGVKTTTTLTQNPDGSPNTSSESTDSQSETFVPPSATKKETTLSALADNSTAKSKTVSNPVSKSKNGGLINKGQLEIPFAKPQTPAEIKNSIANNDGTNANNNGINNNNIDIITPIAPNGAGGIAQETPTYTINDLSPLRYMTPEQEREAIQAILKSSEKEAITGLQLQFDETIFTSDAKPNIDPIDNLNKIKHDNPVEELISYKGLSLTANVQGNSPMLFNNQILKTLTPVGGEVTKALSMRFGFGFGANYQWSKRQSVGLEYNYTGQGQTYLRAISGKNEALDLSANYHHIAALYNYQMPLATERFGLGFTTGLQYGILDANTFKMTGDDRINVNNLTQQDLGLVGGVDANYFINKSTILSVGVRAAYAHDLNRFAVPDPVSNLNVGIRGGITYRLNQK
jgi:hypothetical protein